MRVMSEVGGMSDRADTLQLQIAHLEPKEGSYLKTFTAGHKVAVIHILGASVDARQPELEAETEVVIALRRVVFWGANCTGLNHSPYCGPRSVTQLQYHIPQIDRHDIGNCLGL